LEETKGNLLFLCDPVLGDNNKLYVPKENIAAYLNYLIPVADIITPNQYELEWLSDTKIETEQDAIAAIEIMHSKGVKIVIVTSIFSTYSDKTKIVAMVSSKLIREQDKSYLVSTNHGERIRFRFIIDYLKEYVAGTGDLFSAQLLALLRDGEKSLHQIVGETIGTVHDIVGDTIAKGKSEMLIISSRNTIINPRIKFPSASLEVDEK